MAEQRILPSSGPIAGEAEISTYGRNLRGSGAARPRRVAPQIEQGSDMRPGVRFRPTLAAVLEAETGHQGGHPDRRADALHHRHAQFLAQPVGLEMDRALGDAVHHDDVGAVLVDQRACRRNEVSDHLVLVGADILQLESGSAAAGDPRFHAVIPSLGDLPRDDRLVIADDPETLAELSRDMEPALAGP